MKGVHEGERKDTLISAQLPRVCFEEQCADNFFIQRAAVDHCYMYMFLSAAQLMAKCTI